MAQTSANAGPIPPAKKDDSEDVAWALSTAEAMYARGDRGDALKWLRRAAEAASEAQADDRALELAKAAADLASAIGPTTPSVAPPAAPQPSRPPPPPPARAPTPPPPAPPPPPARPAPPKAEPSKPAKPASPAKPPARAAVPFTGIRPSEPRRSSRRSRPDITIARAPDETTQADAPPEPARRRGRASRPAGEEVTSPEAAVVPPPDPTPKPAPAPPREVAATDATPALHPEDLDAWPTQSLAGDDLADGPDEKTRIGVPAYEVSARLATEASVAPRVEEPGLRPSQAIRVVVWRAADGVHVAPHGTRVAAISVDAVLVALDPSADLATWLSAK